ncbi:MAG: hypothetical protein IPN58_05900 [Anaerolineales bacterium]|nr:hypothetical protein [Anaerolineales bacterium]
MKSKYLFQAFVLLAMLFSTMGTSQQVQAKAESQNVRSVEIVMRSLTYWDAVYSGNVNSNRYEKWPLSFAESHNFAVTVTTTNGDLTPLLILLDEANNEIASAVGTLNSNQPLGNYYVQVQPEAGSGYYTLTIREIVVDTTPSVTTTVLPVSINIDETATATVSLNNVPASGYTSAEFTCTYDSTLVQVSNIADSGLFGADAVMAVNGPQNGSFIVALAGSNGNKAATSGAAFTFSAKGLAAGNTTVDCTARVSSGDSILTNVASTGPASLAIVSVPPPPTDGTLTGQVFASKSVTVSMFAEGVTPAPVVTNVDGTFSLAAPAGTYTVIASADGFLDAQGAAILTAGNITIMPVVTLIAGDIDNNDVIDQYDAMTIGMSYNTVSPAAADLNNDGTINVLDLEIVASNYRMSGALAWQ